MAVGKRNPPSRSVLLILELKCICPVLNEPLDVHFEINLLIDGMNEQEENELRASPNWNNGVME
jgi:hypothetical protein